MNRELLRVIPAGIAVALVAYVALVAVLTGFGS